MKDKLTLKGLQTQLAKMEAKIEGLKTEISSAQKELNLLQKEKKSLQERIRHLSGDGKLIVSEHAILRWLERKHGVDLKGIEREILNDEVLRITDTLGGNGEFPNGDMVLIIKQNVVITVKEG